MVSDTEILAKVCRIIANCIENPLINLNEDTTFENMVYVWKTEQVHPSFKRFPVIRNLLFDITKEFKDSRPYWIWPEYFDFDKTYKNVKTIKDVCNIIRDGYNRIQEIEDEKTNDIKTRKVIEKKLENVNIIDLDCLLNGNPTWQEVQKFFLEEEFDREEYLVKAIKKHLITPAQKKVLFDIDASIEELLNGRISGKYEKKIDKIFKEWNSKLEHKHFGL